MKMKRRAMGVALSASLLGGFLVGCGGSGPAGGGAAVKPAPRVAQSAESALCLNGTFAEGPFNTWVGKLFDFALRNIPEDAAKDLTEAGILGKKLRWAVLSAGKLPAEDAKKGWFPMAKIPPFALAVSFDHDAAKIAAVLERMTKGPGGASGVSKTTVEGLPAWEVAVMGNLLKDRFHPCFTSLDDGKTLLVASLAPGLAEQVRLYRSGEGCAKEGFEAITGLRTSNIALLQTCALGSLVAQYVDAKTLKDFGQMVGISNFADIVAGLRKAELGLSLSSGDVDLVLTLNAETASAADAQTIRDALENGRKMALEGFAKGKDMNVKEGAEKKLLLLKDILEKGVTIAGSGAKLELAIKVPLSLVMEAVDAQIADMENAAAMSRARIEGYRIYKELKKTGWPKVTDGKVPENVRELLKDWHVAVNVTDDMSERIPVLVSSNLDPSLLLGAWDGDTERRTRLSLKNKNKDVSPQTAWRNSAIVVVRKNGFAFCMQKYLNYGSLYLGGLGESRAFSCPEDFAYATANGLVKPARKTGGKK